MRAARTCTQLMMAHSSGLVTVIVPSYNGAEYLRFALDSVLRQTYANLQVIVVDDGSIDASHVVVREFADPRVFYVYQNNAGVSAARNTGIRLAHGEYLAFLDADDEWEPAFLERCVSAMCHKGHAVSGAYTSYVYVDDSGNVLPQTGAPVVPAADLYARLTRENILLIHSVVLRSNVVRQTGGFDVSLGAQEDWDFWLRVTRRHLLQGVLEPLARYRVNPSSRSFDTLKMHETRMRVLAKHFGPLETNAHGFPRAKQEAYGYGYRAAAQDLIRDGRRDGGWRLLAHAAEVLPQLLERVDTFYELAAGEQPRGWRGMANRRDLETNGADLLTRLDMLLASAGPVVRRRRRKAVGCAHLALGMLSQQAHRWDRARHYFVLAVATDPWLLASHDVLRRLVKVIVKSCLGGLARFARPS